MGRRAALARDRARHGSRANPRMGEVTWRACDALSRQQAFGGVHAARRDDGRASPAAQGDVRSARHPEPRPSLRGPLMETNLAPFIRDTPEGREADSVLRACVHCGFCLATCPTYQLLGDELDGPRGRIYLMKQVLGGAAPTATTQLHLDRCLTCRACETTCPSGVQYGRLVDIGRKIVDERVGRKPVDAARRYSLRKSLLSKSVFGTALAVGRFAKGLLPREVGDWIPAEQPAGAWPSPRHTRK